MRRLGVILWRYWSTSLQAELEYRSNFLVQAFGSSLALAGSIFALTLFYRGGGFPGWTFEEGLVVQGLYSAFSGAIACVLSPNLSRIVQHVEAGTLDFVLLKPVDAQVTLSLRVISPWGLPDLVFGLAVIAWGAARAPARDGSVSLALLAVLFGALIIYGLWFVVATTSVWFTKIYNATEVLRGLLDAGRFPMAAYPAAYRFAFTFVMPVAFMTTVPAELLLGRGQPTMLLGSALIALVLLVASRAFWRFALKSYTGASG
ncbi:MAG: ABC-2 family transporter protein [Deltaproteobacteria bacterium]|nr:ABC-2 family transporter protein [Deltaproteobacteria bacterium]